MAHDFGSFYKYLEFKRYQVLAKNGIGSLLYRIVTILLFPILFTPAAMRSRIVNRRNIEGVSLYQMIREAEKRGVGRRVDLLYSYLWYHIVPWEYEAYHFKGQPHKKRLLWLSDADRYMCCSLLMNSTYEVLKNKWNFYKITKDFFKREAFLFHPQTSQNELSAFLERHPTVFVKPLKGSMGAGAFKFDNNASHDISLFDILTKESSSFIIEEIIIQDERMSAWNESSVNSIRFPSFFRDGNWHTLQPCFRTGRKGQVVDNIGAGGVFTVIDETTGRITTNGMDHYNKVYLKHPDSGLTFKDYQLPCWEELLQYAFSIHRSLPPEFIYVGFDFALTEKGWDIIEANWGQFAHQIASQKGVKREFDSYLGIL